jgi:PAS domain S-box-containing protein
MNSKLHLSENGINQKTRKNSYPNKAIHETLTNGFFTVDKKWIVKYWNRSAEILLKVKAKDILGKNLWEEFAGIIPLEFYNVYQKAFSRDLPLHFEEYWGEMDSWFDVITYHTDNTLSVSFKSSNHSNREYLENPVQRLKTLTELYRFVTEITNDSLWEWNLRTNEIFWIDGGHKRVFGYPIENALIPQSFWESLIHPGDKDRVLAGLKEMISRGTDGLWEEEYRFKKADGSYVYVHDRGHIICDEGESSRMIGATQDISERVLLAKKLEEQKSANMKEITTAILAAEEKERKEIGKELHENLSQFLAVTKMYIELAQKSKQKRKELLEKSSGYISDVMREIRRISKILEPPGLEILSLADSIQILLDDFQVINPSGIDFSTDGIDLKNTDQQLQINIFRIIQEQLNNILRHAKASHLEIRICGDKSRIVLVIADNGMGCDLTKKSNGVGIRNIMSRAELYNGTVTIVSKPRMGYSLQIVFQLDEDGENK